MRGRGVLQRLGGSLPIRGVRDSAAAPEATVVGGADLNAFVATAPPAAVEEQAKASARRADSGAPLGPVDGLTIGVKDNFCVGGMPTTCGSEALRSFVPPYTATVVQRLQDAGGIVVGKTGLDEFGMGGYGLNTPFGAVTNPWTTAEGERHASGGSSGGSAAAVAAGQCAVALGSDTGGSVRLPAAYCGVVGWKPSYGRCSRHGLVSYASSLDTPGVIAPTVAEAAAVSAVMSGVDVQDLTTGDAPPMNLPSAPASVDGLTVGVPTEYCIEELSPDVKALWEETCQSLQAAGAQLCPVSLPHTRHALPCYYMIALAEASSNLARYDGMQFGASAGLEEHFDDFSRLLIANRDAFLHPEVKRRVLLGTFALTRGSYDTHFGQAQRVRRRVKGDFDAAFRSGADVLLAPTTVGSAPLLSELESMPPVAQYVNDVFNVPASLAGLPALSLPVGLCSRGMPLSLQVIGQHFEDAQVVQTAAAIEGLARFSERWRPSLRSLGL